MSGGKGGSTTSKVEIPAYIEDASRANLARADEIAKLGYVPYYGPEVAAFTPMQNAAFQGTASAADAFGLSTPVGQNVGGMPPAQTFAGGVQGYSSGSLYDQAVNELRLRNPGQFRAITGMFIDPVTGKDPRNKAFRGNIMDGGAAAGGLAPRGASETARMLEREGSSDRDYSPTVGPRSSFNSLRASLPGGVNDRRLESGFSQTVARAFNSPQRAPTAASRPTQRPSSRNNGGRK